MSGSSQPHRSTEPQARAAAVQAQASGLDFQSLSARAAGDEKLKAAIGSAVMRQYTGRRLRLLDLPDAQQLRALAGRIRQHALDHLDYYLELLAARVRQNGGQVHFAADAADARRIIIQIARDNGCRSVVKSKSMVSEEIGLRPAMEEAGLDVVETDLGEFIIQMAGEGPSHIVGPCIHKTAAAIGKLFSEYFGTPYSEDPGAMTRQARAYLREKFRRADMGMTGANFVVAETGLVCAVENEGNVRQSITTPRILVSVTGIEKVIPRMADLAVFLKLLGRSSTGQAMTVYTNLFGGPREAGEGDGPEQFHLVLVDNGRSRILGSEYREALRCIRCGACLNACPVYRKIGGHAYGHVYSGPIGAILAPLMQGRERFRDLPQASTLCGACFEACPVMIDIPSMLIRLRGEDAARGGPGWRQRLAHRAWAEMLKSPLLYGVLGRINRWLLRRRADEEGYISKGAGMVRGWTDVRDLPMPATKTFHQLWRGRRK